MNESFLDKVLKQLTGSPFRFKVSYIATKEGWDITLKDGNTILAQNHPLDMHSKEDSEAQLISRVISRLSHKLDEADHHKKKVAELEQELAQLKLDILNSGNKEENI